MPKKDEALEVSVAMSTPGPEEYVTFTAPYSDDEWDDTIYISVNGEDVRILRGETVKIKQKFASVYENSKAQKRVARENRKKAKMAEPIKM